MDAEVARWKAPNSKLELAVTAPRLLSLRDCILVVPGTLLLEATNSEANVPGQYDPVIKLDDQAFIDGFDPIIDIIPSKQVPRKLVIRSYDKDFTFLLKGPSFISLIEYPSTSELTKRERRSERR